MGKFYTPLKVVEITESVTGRPKWRLLEPLVYRSHNHGYIIIDKGFETDISSVPRVPFVFWLVGSRGNKQACLHDFLYTTPHQIASGQKITRRQADCIYRSSLTDDLKYDPDVFDNFFIRYLIAHFVSFTMWAGVRLFGAGHWEK